MLITFSRLAMLFILGSQVACIGREAGSDKDYAADVGSLIVGGRDDVSETHKLPASGAGFGSHLKSAIIQNPSVAAAQYASSGAQSAIKSAGSGLRPQISGSALMGAHRNDLGASSTEAGAALNARLSQLIYDGGLAESSVSIAEIKSQLAESAVLLAVNDAATQAVNVWLATWRAQSDLAALESLEKEVRPHVEQVERMAASGIVDRSVSDVIATRLLELELAKQDVASELSAASYSFGKTFGLSPWKISYPELAFDIQKLEVDKLVVSEIPALREGALRLMLALEQQKLAEAKYAPRVSFDVGASSPIDRGDQPTGQIGLNVAYTFYDGGKRDADVEQAKADVEQAQYSLSSLRQQLDTTLNQLRQRRAYLKASADLTAQKVAVLVRRLETAASQIQTGQADISKVFEMKVQMRQLKASQLRARSDLRSVEYELGSIIGLISFPQIIDG